MNDALVGGLGLPPEVWMFLTILSCLFLFFKFGRFWSVRNLDLLLLFAQTPGMVRLVGRGEAQSWSAFVLLFAGTGVWLVRCLVDLGFSRRPLLEPNLNSDGLACFVLGLLGLVLVETAIFDETPHSPRNPGDPHAQEAMNAAPPTLGTTLKSPPGEVAQNLRRLLAATGHLGIVFGLFTLGSKRYARPAIGLAMALCFLILPYSRIALLDSGQLVPAALIALAMANFRRPAVVGGLLGFSAAWMPPVLFLLPLWCGFYWGRGARRFLLVSIAFVAGAAILTWFMPQATSLARGLGARGFSEAGLYPASETPRAGSFWTQVEPAYRLPVFVLYAVCVGVAAIWPTNKNFGQLLALSAATLLGSQFWYLDEGGTLVVLYLPLIIALVFRPNLSTMRPDPAPSKSQAGQSLFAQETESQPQ